MRYLVSIIIPVYNSEKFLKRCLDSLTAQTLKEIELICIDDGSTDNSAHILDDYCRKHSNMTVIHQCNSGLSSARNRGLNVAQGEYVCFIDSDDWVDNNFTEKLYNAAAEYQADIAVGGIIRLHKFRRKYYLKFNNFVCSSDFKEKVNLCCLPKLSYVWNKIYRTEFLIRNNLKFEEGRIYEDIIFTPQVLYYSNKIVTVPNTYYYYWRGTNTLVKRRDKKALKDVDYAHKFSVKFFAERNIDLTPKILQVKRVRIFGQTILKISENSEQKTIRIFNIPVYSLKK